MMGSDEIRVQKGAANDIIVSGNDISGAGMYTKGKGVEASFKLQMSCGSLLLYYGIMKLTHVRH